MMAVRCKLHRIQSSKFGVNYDLKIIHINMNLKFIFTLNFKNHDLC